MKIVWRQGHHSRLKCMSIYNLRLLLVDEMETDIFFLERWRAACYCVEHATLQCLAMPTENNPVKSEAAFRVLQLINR